MWYMRHRGIRRFSDLQARALTPYINANLISILRILMTGAMLAAFLAGSYLAGGTLFLFATYLDFLDGAVARYQDAEGLALAGWGSSADMEEGVPFFKRLLLKGSTETGAWLDPLADKILVHTAILALGWELLPHTLLWTGLALAALLTGARPFKKWLEKKGCRESAGGRANAFGKMKMWAQSVLVLILLLRIDAAALPLQYAALGLAGLSLVWHFLPTKK